MNHLLHLYLVEPHPGARLGALLGDYIKGPLDRRLPEKVLHGIVHHRQLDSFAETAVAFRRSKKRLNPKLRHCRGILVDIAYDHFLAKNWGSYHSQPLEEFAASIHLVLQTYQSLLPPSFCKHLPRMLAINWLVALRNLDHIEIVLQRLAARLSRPNLLGKGIEELLRHQQGLETDFAAFMLEAHDFFQLRSTAPLP
ncbi:MAG: ACP phosphodiesterase [Pedobacter sp.]